jgi:hypothetical protein
MFFKYDDIFWLGQWTENRARKINSCSWGGVGWGGLLTSFVLTTTLLSFLTTSSYVLDVTLLIDAAWSALRQYIPNCLSSHSRNLILYCKSWQWRYINFHANAQKKTIEALKCILWVAVQLNGPAQACSMQDAGKKNLARNHCTGSFLRFEQK